jgi:hypothetical protein
MGRRFLTSQSETAAEVLTHFRKREGVTSMHDITLPHNGDKVPLELVVGNPAMIGQLRAAGDEKAQQVLGGRWLEIGFAACSYAGTVMDTSIVQQEFKQFQRDLVTVCNKEIVDAIVHQFSPNNDDGILAHLVKILQDGNGELVEKLSDGNTEHHNNLDQRIAVLSRQFSTDYPDSALSKLVRTLSDGSQKIVGQFTLDDPNSSLSRMQGAIVELLRTAAAGAQQHQQEVAKSLAVLTTRREADAKSPRHGLTFQDRVLAYFADFAGRRGHVFEDVSSRPGLIPRCKTGDGVLTVGPDYLAKDAPIGIEAKDERYSVPKMRAEAEQVRKNRGTNFVVFVIKAACAPPGMPDFKLYGNDTIVVKWDDEDPATNIYLDAAADVACALATRQAAEKKGQSVDFTAIDRTINSIENNATGLGQIFISATTIRNAADKILDESKPKHAALIEELTTLRDHIAALRGPAGAS